MSQFRTTPAGGLVAQRSLQRSPGMVSILAAFTLAFPIGCSSGVRELELGALPDSSELEAMSVSDLLNDEATDEPTLEESAPCDDSSLRSDPKNCGACGYACAEHVPCVEGRCGDVVQLSVGITMTCARLSTGQVLCWLRSADGIARPALIEGLSDAVELDTDGSLGCVRRASGKVACWGDYDFGSFSSSPFTLVATAIKGIDDAIGLAVGSNHACALRADATVACWGKNTLGQLGNATGHSSTGVVYAVETLQGVVQLAAGGAHTCARLDTGAVRCWGSNSEGQLGDNTTEQRSQPVEVSGVLDAVDLVLGEHHSCVRLRSGQVSCWGGGPTLGLGREPQPVTPVPGFAGASAIAAGYQHTCALHDTGRVSCIGTNQEGEFGVEKPDSSAVPVDVPELFDVVELSAGFLQTCARLLDGRVECWGTGRTQGGDGSAVPVQVDGLSEITELAVAGWASCARPSTGPWRCWGGNYKGQLGVVGNWSPTPVLPPHADAPEMSLGSYHLCAREADGGVWCWGKSVYGACGNELLLSPPSLIAGLGEVRSLGLGAEHSCALSTDGDAVCWGANERKQSGYDDRLMLTEPSPVQLGQPAEALSASWYHTCALMASGEVYCWGENGSGELGRESEERYAPPAPMEGVFDAVQVSTGYYHTCVLRSTGAVLCTGDNSYGQLGGGFGGSTAVPVPAAISEVVELAAGNEQSYARLSDGRIAFWGSANSRMSGDGSTGFRAKPVFVRGIDDAVALRAGYAHVCVLRRSGEVWCWGENVQGQLGSPPSAAGKRVTIPGLASRRCGDGVLYAGEGCDDGNEAAGDGCDATCAIEAGWQCDPGAACRLIRPGEDCAHAVPIMAPASVVGSFEGLFDDYNPGSRGCTPNQASGGDFVYQLTLAAGESVELSASSEADLVLYASAQCPEIVSSCVKGTDAQPGGGTERLLLSNSTDSERTRFVVIDAYVGSSASFEIKLTQR